MTAERYAPKHARARRAVKLDPKATSDRPGYPVGTRVRGVSGLLANHDGLVTRDHWDILPSGQMVVRFDDPVVDRYQLIAVYPKKSNRFDSVEAGRLVRAPEFRQFRDHRNSRRASGPQLSSVCTDTSSPASEFDRSRRFYCEAENRGRASSINLVNGLVVVGRLGTKSLRRSVGKKSLEEYAWAGCYADLS